MKMDSASSSRPPGSPKFGEVWMCKLPTSSGSVQQGYRPVIVISNNVNNMYSSTVNIIPITSKPKKRLPIHVELNNYLNYGLKTPSIALVEQIMTIPKDCLIQALGAVRDSDTITRLSTAIKIQFPVIC